MGGLLLSLAVAAVRPDAASAQQLPPATPGQPPTTLPPTTPGPPTTGPGEPSAPPTVTPTPTPSEAQPVPVIPESQLIPNPTVPSVPQRVLPTPVLRGPTTARFQLEPTLTLSEEYTDNFDLTERNRRSNFRSTVAPGLGLTLNTPLIKGLVAYKFAPSYDTADDETSLFHSLLGQVVWDVTPRWKLTLADALTRSDQPGEADRLGLRQQRQTFTSNIASIVSDYLIGSVATRESYQFATFSDDTSDTKSHTLSVSATVPIYQTNSLSAGYEYLTSQTTGGSSTGTNGLGSSGDSDVSGHRVTAGVARQLNRLYTLGITGSYALRKVTDDTTGNSHFRLWNVSVSSDYQVTGRLKITSLLGVSRVTTDSGDSVGPNLSTRTNITYQFARAEVSLGLDRGFSETFSDGQNFGVVETEGVTGSLAYRLTPSFTATLSGAYRRSKTTGIGDPTQSTANEETRNWGGTFLLSWLIRRSLGLELGYTYTKQVGSDSRQTSQSGANRGFGIENSYTENRVRVSVNLTF